MSAGQFRHWEWSLMRTMKLSILALLALALCSCRADAADSRTLEAQVLALTNAHRVVNGLLPLVRAPELDVAAIRHCNDMATKRFFGHIGSDGSNPIQRVAATGYRWILIGENIAAGYLTAQGVVDAWMASAGHRANILNPRFTEIGLGHLFVAGSPWGTYWTQVFSARTAVPAPPPVPVPVPPTPTPPLVPVGEIPNLVSVLPRAGYPGVTLVTLNGSNFGVVRGAGRVTLRKLNTQVYAAVTHVSWAPEQVTIRFTTPQRGWHFARVVRSDGRGSIQMLFYVR